MRDEDERKVLEKELKRWEATTLRDAIESHPERRKEFVTTSSRPVKRLYTPLDPVGKTENERLGAPGEFPFTRGIHPTMYRGRLWTMRMFAGYGSAEDTNRRFKYLISHGETGLSVAFDMPTLYGYDTDAADAKGEFGTCGVAVSSLDDMKILFRGIDAPSAERNTGMLTVSPSFAVGLAPRVGTPNIGKNVRCTGRRQKRSTSLHTFSLWNRWLPKRPRKSTAGVRGGRVSG